MANSVNKLRDSSLVRDSTISKKSSLIDNDSIKLKLPPNKSVTTTRKSFAKIIQKSDKKVTTLKEEKDEFCKLKTNEQSSNI